MWRLVVFTSCKVRLSLEVPRLNTPVLFPFGSETRFFNFPFVIDILTCNLCCFFSSFWGEWTCSIRFMNAKSYFYEMIFCWNWPLTLDQITKRKTRLKLCFVFWQKSPISVRQIVEIHFLKMLKANLCKNRNNPKNRPNWTLYFRFGRRWLGHFHNRGLVVPVSNTGYHQQNFIFKM